MGFLCVAAAKEALYIADAEEKNQIFPDACRRMPFVGQGGIVACVRLGHCIADES